MKKDEVLEGEVHDMDELNSRRKSSNESASGSNSGKSTLKELQGAPVVWKALSVVIAMLALAYDLSPIDAVPDAIPVLGWLDDVGVTVMAAMNVYQQFAKDQNSTLVKLIRYTKWMLVALVVIAGVAVGGLVAAIIALVA